MGVFDVVENTPSCCVDSRIVAKCDGRGSVTRGTIQPREEVLDTSHSISGTGVADGGIGLDVGDSICRYSGFRGKRGKEGNRDGSRCLAVGKKVKVEEEKGATG